MASSEDFAYAQSLFLTWLNMLTVYNMTVKSIQAKLRDREEGKHVMERDFECTEIPTGHMLHC